MVEKCRDERLPIVATLMAELGLEEHQAKYHYNKVTKKGLVETRKKGHAPRIAIMFLNSPNEERITLCQICHTPWPCNVEVVRRARVWEKEQQVARERAAAGLGDAPESDEPK